MKNAMTIAKLTFLQAIRMKVAVAFIVLLAVCLIAMPSVMTGDGTLAGQIRSTLYYAFSLVTILLSLQTLLVGAMLVSEDIRRRQIFLIAVKPISRSEYLIGRFLGVMFLNVLLLTVSSVAIWSMVQSKRAEETTIQDRIAIETELFTARERLAPVPPNLDTMVQERVAYLKQKGAYNELLEAYRRSNKLLENESPEEKFHRSLYIQARQIVEIVSPGRRLTWQFEGVEPQGESQTAVATLDKAHDTYRIYRFKADPAIVGRMSYGAPIRFGPVAGQITRIAHGIFNIQLPMSGPLSSTFATMKHGDTIQFVIDPVMQFQYTAQPTSDVPNDIKTLPRILEIGPPGAKPTAVIPSQGVIRSTSTNTFSAIGVAENGKMQVSYWNVPLTGQFGAGTEQIVTAVKIPYKDVSLLYRVGDFTPNFVRCCLLTLMRLTFLAAMAIMLSSILEFPVAVLTSMTLLIGSMLVGWLITQRWGDAGKLNGFFDYFNYFIRNTITTLMPDVGGDSSSELLSEGMSLSYTSLGKTFLMTIVVRSGLYLALGCFLFNRRELAEAGR